MTTGKLLSQTDVVIESIRQMLIDGFRMLESKKEELPPRKHGNMPL